MQTSLSRQITELANELELLSRTAAEKDIEWARELLRLRDCIRNHGHCWACHGEEYGGEQCLKTQKAQMCWKHKALQNL